MKINNITVNEPILYLSTWQSIYKQKREYFDQFSCLIGDEVHEFEGASTSKITEKCTQAFFRFGFTGTLKDAKSHEMSLKSLFGPVSQVSNTKDLMDRGVLSNMAVRAIVLAHSESSVKGMGKATYQQEMDFISTHTKRNHFIANLAKASSGNTLIMVQFVESHGKLLEQILKDVCGDEKEVYFVYGETESKQRERVRNLCEHHDNIVILATYQVFQRGINIRSLHNLILASPTKSKIRLLQSIGRSLRKAKDKSKANVIDVADDLRGNRKTNNITLKHFIERYELYTREGFDVDVKNVPL